MLFNLAEEAKLPTLLFFCQIYLKGIAKEIALC